MAKSKQLTPADMKILVIGPTTWGRGDTLAEALVKAEKPRRYIAYVSTPETYVNEMGDICYPEGNAPKEFLRKGIQ